MRPPVVHQPRVAWDGARTFVRAVEAGLGDWLAGRMGDEFGAEYRRRLVETRIRMLTSPRPDIVQVEAGMWRVRLADLLGEHPDAAEDVSRLTRETALRLG